MFERILHSVERHVHLTEREAAYFTSLLRPVRLPRRGLLLKTGDVSRHETFVTKGVMRAFNVDKEGNEYITMFALEGWWIGDMYSFLTGTPSQLNIDALEDCDLLQISKDDLEKLYVDVPKFDRFFRILLQNAFVANQERILSSMSLTAEEKYYSFLKKYPTLEQRIPQHHIASYLGITPETISRIRRKAMASRS